MLGSISYFLCIVWLNFEVWFAETERHRCTLNLAQNGGKDASSKDPQHKLPRGAPWELVFGKPLPAPNGIPSK